MAGVSTLIVSIAKIAYGNCSHVCDEYAGSIMWVGGHQKVDRIRVKRLHEPIICSIGIGRRQKLGNINCKSIIYVTYAVRNLYCNGFVLAMWGKRLL